MAEEANGVVDGIVGEFSTYEDYLDSQISATDLYYLEDEDLARQLVVRRPAGDPCLCRHVSSRPLPRAGAGLPRQRRDPEARGV